MSIHLNQNVPTWAQKHVDIWRSREHLIGEDESQRKPVENQSTQDTFIRSQAESYRSLDDVLGVDRRHETPGVLEFFKPAPGEVSKVHFQGTGEEGTFLFHKPGVPGDTIEYQTFEEGRLSQLTLTNNVLTGKVEGQALVIDTRDPSRSFSSRLG